jgi:hypothetical protein
MGLLGAAIAWDAVQATSLTLMISCCCLRQPLETYTSMQCADTSPVFLPCKCIAGLAWGCWVLPLRGTQCRPQA